MGKLPRDISGRRVVSALERIGFYVLHQRASHIILRRESPKTTISVPDHRVLRVGTLRSILTQAGLDVQDFLQLL
jgi:predicted RNA binding protein YcfA (HicA-like mRNA interferase family)